jgi:hypothetical protein
MYASPRGRACKHKTAIKNARILADSAKPIEKGIGSEADPDVLAMLEAEDQAAEEHHGGEGKGDKQEEEEEEKDDRKMPAEPEGKRGTKREREEEVAVTPQKTEAPAVVTPQAKRWWRFF